MAPFKFHFSKMSKSRSKESRSSSTEAEEAPEQGTSCPSESAKTERAAITNNDNFPHSPPPSYEHVLQETRLKQSTSEAAGSKRQSEDDDSCKNNKITKAIPKSPEILIHKSSKELYRAVAKQWGITCKMSDQCRCFDCQSHYFDCEYEKDEQEKTDGGLGAGTPMFIAEVMHGTACVLL